MNSKEITLLVQKKQGNSPLYINKMTLKTGEISSERELVKRIYSEHGRGRYMIQYQNERGRFSKKIWKAMIHEEGEEAISFLNVIDAKILESLGDIEQCRPTDRHMIELPKQKVK